MYHKILSALITDTIIAIKLVSTTSISFTFIFKLEKYLTCLNLRHKLPTTTEKNLINNFYEVFIIFSLQHL